MKVKSIRFPYLRYGLMLIIMTTAYYVAGRLALLLAIPAGLVFTGLLGVFLLVVTGYIARVEQLAAELSETNTDMKREIAEQKRQKQLLRENEEQIRASLRGKELQLKEIHHRVKNNLQIIASLLDLQSESITVSQVLQTFQESQNRIRSMVPIHEHLYESGDLAQIDCGQYTQELAYHLFNSYEARTRGIIPELDVDAIFLGIDTAIPCGLILNELISNALKHAFPDGKEGEVHIVLRSGDDNQLILIIRDTGIGFPQELDFQNTDTLGLQLACTLTDQ